MRHKDEGGSTADVSFTSKRLPRCSLRDAAVTGARIGGAAAAGSAIRRVRPVAEDQSLRRRVAVPPLGKVR